MTNLETKIIAKAKENIMLEKIDVVDLIEVLENGCVQVRTKTSIREDGVEISGKFHRHVVAPGQDYSQEDPRVQAICAAVQTPEVVAAYQAAQAAVLEAAQEVNKPQLAE